MKQHSLENILECTLHCCNISKEEWLQLKHRKLMYIVRAKQLVSHIAYNEGYKHEEIAQFLGLNRTSVIHDIKTLNQAMQIYPTVQDLVDRIIHELGPFPQDHQKQMVAYGWLARSSTGLLTISPHVLERLGGYWMAVGSRPFPSDQFPQVTYETGPVKVKIKVTLEEDEKV